MSRILILALVAVCTLTCTAQPTLSDEVRENIKLRVANGQNTGIVIGMIDAEGVNYYSYGVKSFKTNEPVNEETVFEIGSVSKVFTGILLAEQVKKGGMKLDDPVGLYLPESVKAPVFNGESIRIVQLSNHTSGLPRLPSNFDPADPANPYADYSEAQLFEFLNTYELTRSPGSQYEYSNYAVGLLGFLLATQNDTDYEELMLSKIAKPLSLKNTQITLDAKLEKRLAIGHNLGYEVKNWELPTLAGAGAIRSTASDMVKFLQFNMGLEKHRLFESMQLAHQNSRTDGGQPPVGLGWHRAGANADIIWHNGGTGGYRSFVGFVESEKRGVVILTNSSEGVDDLGFHLLNSNAPLRTIKPSIATEIEKIIAEKGTESGVAAYADYKQKEPDTYEFGEMELQRLANIYQMKDEMEKAIAVLKLNLEVYPNSSSTYSNLGEVYFKTDNKEASIESFKKALALNPANSHATERLKELGVDPEGLAEEVVVGIDVLESYVGQYQLAPGFIVTISREENQLNAQATGQPKFPVFPKSENEFYFKVVEAQLTFNKGADGKIESVTLFQGGREIVGKKM